MVVFGFNLRLVLRVSGSEKIYLGINIYSVLANEFLPVKLGL